ncbi:unnamed protein product, partial [Choristocarpus tenellus]
SPDSSRLAVLTLDKVLVFELDTPMEEGSSWSFGINLAQQDQGQMQGGEAEIDSDDPVQLAFWDNRTLAMALSRGRIQLRDLAPLPSVTVAAMSSATGLLTGTEAISQETTEVEDSSGIVVKGRTGQHRRAMELPVEPPVTADWSAHCGLVTCMAARRVGSEALTSVSGRNDLVG